MTTAKPAQKTLFERIGGKDAVNAAVDLFYQKIMADSRVSGMFDNIDMNRQRAKQKAFLTYAFGGAPNYPGRSLRRSHERLVKEKGLNENHFLAVAEDLQATLKELNVPHPLISEVMALVASTRDDVLNR